MTNEQEREAFEAWYRKNGNNCQGIRWVDALVWSAWQARAALASQVVQEPVAVRYRSGKSKRWRYLNFPFTKGWTFPESLGTPEPLYAAPVAAGEPQPPSLWPVIQWLEAGCDPQWAAKELRLYAERMSQPDTRGVAPAVEARQKLIEDAITKATGEHRVLSAYDYEDVFACCEAVLSAAGVQEGRNG